jgi:hypothetical protein
MTGDHLLSHHYFPENKKTGQGYISYKSDCFHISLENVLNTSTQYLQITTDITNSIRESCECQLSVRKKEKRKYYGNYLVQ